MMTTLSLYQPLSNDFLDDKSSDSNVRQGGGGVGSDSSEILVGPPLQAWGLGTQSYYPYLNLTILRTKRLK